MATVLLIPIVMVATMRDREKIAAALRSELDQAILCQEQRRIEYQSILRHLSREGSCPDDADRLQRAFRAEMDARNTAWKALHRLTDFLEEAPETARSAHG
jgi:hypothetical protein